LFSGSVRISRKICKKAREYFRCDNGRDKNWLGKSIIDRIKDYAVQQLASDKALLAPSLHWRLC